MSALTVEVMAILDKDASAGRASELDRLLERRIVPVFDFEHMTRIALARNWRLASPAQQLALVAQFKTLLVRTYSQALLEFLISQAKRQTQARHDRPACDSRVGYFRRRQQQHVQLTASPGLGQLTRLLGSDCQGDAGDGSTCAAVALGGGIALMVAARRRRAAEVSSVD